MLTKRIAKPILGCRSIYSRQITSLYIRQFSRSSVANNKEKSSGKKEAPPPPPDGKTPIQVFFDVFKTEWDKSSELKSEIRALQDATGKMGESDAFKKAKDAYESAQKGTNFVGSTLKKTGEKLGDAAEAAWESDVGKSTRKVVGKTAEKVDEAFEPVRKTQTYKDISEVIDDGSSSAYGGFITKEQRRRKRENEIALGKRKVIKSNDEAPTAVTTTDFKVDGPSVGEKWDKFKSTTTFGKFIADLRLRWDESENGLVSLFRGIFEKIGSFFQETERARVIKQFRLMDPTFTTEDFTKNLREYVLPELLDAYVKGDEKVLKQWISEAPFNVWSAGTKQYREKGLYADGKVLDIRGVDILSAKLLPPADMPVLVVTCRAQEINIYRDIKTGDVMAGTESNILLNTYAIVLTRIPEEMDNKETEGWKIIEFARGQSRNFT